MVMEQLSMEVIEHIINASPNGVLVTDSSATILYVNSAFEVITGYTKKEIIGGTPRILSSGLHTREFYVHMWKVLDSHNEFESVFHNRRKDGTIYTQIANIKKISVGSDIFYVCMFKDINDAPHDACLIEDTLTRLPNRIGAQIALQRYIEVCKITHKHIGVVFIDINDFQNINDKYGHNIGDELIILVSKRILNAVRRSDYLCRVGGDEFVCISYGDYNQLQILTEKIQQHVTKPYYIGETPLYINCSIGVAIYPESGNTVDSLLANADSALDYAKMSGKNTKVFYEPSITQKNNREVQILTALRQKQIEGITIYYQPQLDINTGKIIAVEALCRWQHPELGSISPAEFIPIAEKTHLIIDLGYIIIEKIIQDVANNRRELLDVTVSINISNIQLKYSNVLLYLTDILKKYKLPYECIELEFTETYMLDNSNHILQQIEMLSSAGFSTALDDFGIGYANIKNFKQLNLSKLKIDKLFVDNITSPKEYKIIKSMIEFGRNLGMYVIVEGVEHMNQLRILKECNCDGVQGYIVSKPVDMKTTLQLIQNNQTRECEFKHLLTTL
jgi:diguanylate cyclase (GGDEF)-like protein/PAS domain S-box-containing protein